MTDEPTAEPTGETTAYVVQQVPPDDLVERTLEKAASKISNGTIPSQGSLSRFEALGFLGVLIVLNLGALLLGLLNWGATQEHRDDFKSICQIIVKQAPPEVAKDLAEQLAECLK